MRKSVADMFVVIALQFITSDIKPQPDSDNDDTPLPSLGHSELFEMILDENPAPIVSNQPEASSVLIILSLSPKVCLKASVISVNPAVPQFLTIPRICSQRCLM
jgi:hypothetical protein